MPSAQVCVWHVYPEAALLHQRAAQGIERLAAEAITARGAFRVVLAGGNTPCAVYERLHDIKTAWQSWHIYFGDERCLPAGHAERNSTMASQAWLAHVAIPATQIHVIPAELGAEEAARRYALSIESVEKFDLVLLGLGLDGHTASLFPGQNYGSDSCQPAVLAVHQSPKPPADRVSLSAWRLSEARSVWFLVQGKDKEAAVRKWRSGEEIPAVAIEPADGVDVWIDAAALGENTN
ncbi:6-phosphogluconolactonase [Sulfurimicrobium lacus]|uniref:6-phosphogluconolactonase n=1 Tax=Sulfurimicrobium lacus TaxID=2715678 RepID=A0A6F8VEG1_9PROT|nr:6-phosphogluconolactonase [Sulfurimicrobium lacus]BCB27730.1 6-phosphogluconolactonase [Sulfurimicrobium lacus]